MLRVHVVAPENVRIGNLMLDSHLERAAARQVLLELEASDRAEKLMHESMQRPDFIEGITSFFEKRPPNFPPLKEDTP